MTVRYSKKFLLLYRMLPNLAFTLFIFVTAFTAPPEITRASWGFALLGLPSLALMLYYLREFVQRPIRLEVTKNGIDDRGLGVGFIPWHDMRLIVPWKKKDSGEGLSLFMDPEVRAHYLQECSGLRQIGNRMNSYFTRTPGLVITTTGYDRSRDEILDFMQEHHARAIDPAERLTD